MAAPVVVAVPLTYRSKWYTRSSPKNGVGEFNYKIPHRVYAFTNSTGSTHYITNQNIRNPLSGSFGQSNAVFNRLLRTRVIAVKGGHSQYIKNMVQNILAARRAAMNGELARRAKIRERNPRYQLSQKQKNGNNAHEKQMQFWNQVRRVLNGIPNTITRGPGSVPAGVRNELFRRSRQIRWSY